MQAGLKKQLLAAACAPYATRRRDYYWARGKLSRDPVFAALLARQVFRDRACIVDLGCGRGLLAAWLLAAEQLAAGRQWTAPLLPPQGLRLRGIELDVDEAARGNAALQPVYGERVTLVGGDIRCAELAGADVVVLLDVLHYIPHADQERLLDRVRAALGPDGLLVARVGDVASGWRFRFSQWVDRCVALVQRRPIAPSWGRPLADWLRLLEARGFAVQAQPMSRGTLFANVLLICRVV